jgi:flagella basal body P-ring formation protein FlgA
MNLRARQRSWPAFAVFAAAGVAAGADASTLEQRLRAARPDVVRWQLRPLDARAGTRAGDIAAVGRVAARMPVRYADGHVAWFAVAAFKPVLVSAHTLETRAVVTARDATSAERDVLALGCEPLGTLAPNVRWRTTRRLATGEPLCASTVEPAPDVERDAAVTLTAQRGAIRVSRVLTADSDARAGERVRLRDRDSGATLMAIVTGPGHARDPDSEELR